MRVKLFTTEAERQRARSRLLGPFFGLMLLVTIAFVVIVAGRYALGLW